MEAAILLSLLATTQTFPPGYVDPEPVLAAAERAIGAPSLRCVTLSGSGYAGIVGQQRLAEKNVDWPRVTLAYYRRSMNWEGRTMTETIERAPGLYPASWKWGPGFVGGTPVQNHPRQTFVVNRGHAWYTEGETSTPAAVPPEIAELWQLDLWLNPHGFLKAARMPGADPVAVWRWELGEMGRDGPTVAPEKVTVVSIRVMGKYRVDATINEENLLQRIHTWVADPVLGDMNYEHEFTNESYVDLGEGIRFPTSWHHHSGWDDNYNTQTISAGHNAFGGDFADVQANACEEPPPVPDSVFAADWSVRVEAEALAEGVYLLSGASHNSVAVELDDFVVVIEAPLDEARSLAVIEEVVRRIPGKPIRYLVNTHQHFDHIGGLRAYLHIGATVITHWKNYDFYNRDVLNYTPRTVAPDMVSLWPPTELTEGYNLETVRESYVVTSGDGDRMIQIFYVHPLAHAEGMLMAYLPRERILVEADLFDTHLPRPWSATESSLRLRSVVETLGLDVSRIVPIHGRPVPWSELP